MSTKSLDSSLNKQDKNSLLSQKQLDELKNAFSDLTKGIDQPIIQGNQKVIQKSSFFETLIRLKTIFSQINSRQFTRFAQFSSQIQIGKQIARRPQLLKVNITMSIVEILAFAISAILPKKYVNKALFSLTVLTVEIQVLFNLQQTSKILRLFKNQHQIILFNKLPQVIECNPLNNKPEIQYNINTEYIHRYQANTIIIVRIQKIIHLYRNYWHRQIRKIKNILSLKKFHYQYEFLSKKNNKKQ